MGIRINKRIGYALTDFQYDTENWEATDPRINLDIFNSEDGEDLYDIQEEFEDWVLTKPEEVKHTLTEELGLDEMEASLYQTMDWDLLKEKLKRNPFHRPLTHAPEFGMPEVLLFQPLSSPDWTRHDDLLDHYENATHNPDMEPTLLDLNAELHHCGIYPYSGMMYRHPDSKTPEELLKPRDAYTDAEWKKELSSPYGIRQGMLHGRTYNMMTGYFDNSIPAPNEAIKEHLLKDWNSRIPEDILLFTHYSKIFIDFNTVYRLKPVIYTYWA